MFPIKIAITKMIKFKWETEFKQTEIGKVPSDFREAFSHCLKELNIPNIAISLQRCDFEKIQKAHDSIHEFMLIPTGLINSNEDFWAKSAFIYHSEAFDQAHRSLLEALSGYYNAACTLLRNALELILKGAFFGVHGS